jgi:hypothetical protein
MSSPHSAEDAKTFSASCIGSVHANEITRKNQIVCLINIPTQAWSEKDFHADMQYSDK